MKNENINISVVQGDILEVYFVLEGISNEDISKVFFSCAEQSLAVECEYSSSQQGYGLRLDSDETDVLEAKQSRYDLTVRFTDGNDFTAVYEGVFAVFPKRNAIRDGGDDNE